MLILYIMPNVPYECICCGFTTKLKGDMRRHLYNKKKPCPKSVNNIDLTDEIREFILENRVYHIPKEPSITQTINNFNTINNFIANMDTIDKLSKYVDYKNITITDVSDSIESRLSTRAMALENKRYDMQIRRDDIFEIIDEVSSLNNGRIQDFNILYDKKYDKLRMYDSGAWKEFLLHNGCKALLLHLQDGIFDAYECYLIKKFKASKPYDQAKIRQLLEDYYKTLGCFDVPPYVKDRSDLTIMEDESKYDDDTYEIQEEFLEIYEEVSNKLTKNEINKVRKDVVKILSRNSRKNIDDLNKKVLELFKIEEGFKKIIQASA